VATIGEVEVLRRQAQELKEVVEQALERLLFKKRARGSGPRGIISPSSAKLRQALAAARETLSARQRGCAARNLGADRSVSPFQAALRKFLLLLRNFARKRSLTASDILLTVAPKQHKRRHGRGNFS
jgi:hypothetical protein